MKQERQSYIQKFFYALFHYGPWETMHLVRQFFVRRIWRLRLRRPLAKPYVLPCAAQTPLGRAVLRDTQATEITPPAGHVLTGADTDFSGTRTVVLSHHDADGLVEPYVRLLGRHFRAEGYLVVLSSNTELRPQNARPRWAEGVVCNTGAADSFDAWKAALGHFPSLLQCHELILCNDHFFGPMGSFAPVHQRMASQACDFWGMSERRLPAPHVAPYYMTFRESALQNSAFRQFFAQMDDAPAPDVRAWRGVALTRWLQEHGLCAAVYLAHPAGNPDHKEQISYHWREALLSGLPLLHQEAFENSQSRRFLGGWREIMAILKYPPLVITRCFWRKGSDISCTYGSGKRYADFPPDVFCLRQDVDFKTPTPQAAIPPADSPVEPLHVVIHCFYPNVLHDMLQYLEHLPRHATLCLSTDSEAKKEEIEKMLQPLGFAAQDVRIVPNKGWDIAPFLVGFADVLRKPGLILKVHAKGSLHKNDGHIWRTLIYDSLMGSQERVQQVLAWFAAHPGFGMLAPPTLPTIEAVLQGVNHSNITKLLQPHGIKIPRDAAIDFPVGSMFWCRTPVLRPWLDMNLSFDDFEDTASSPRDGTLGHAFERVFFFGCGLERQKWGRVGPVHAEPLANLFVDSDSDGLARKTR